MYNIVCSLVGNTHKVVSSILRIITNPTPFLASFTIKCDIIKLSFFLIGFPLNSLIFGNGGL